MAPRFGVRERDGHPTLRAAVAVLLLLVPHSGLALAADGDEAGKRSELPTRASDLFRMDKVWSLHLRFTPEDWAAMEPAAGANPFDPSNMGHGMFLTPLVMRDGDVDKSGGLSAEEFRGLGERWFAAWDEDEDGHLDAKQVREGLKRMLQPPGAEGGPGPEDGGGPPPSGPPPGSRKGKRNGLSSMMGIDFAYVRAGLEFEGRAFADVAVRYKGNGTFLESRGTLKRSLKIDLNKYTKGQDLAGVTTLNLHNNVTDAGMMNEVLAYRLYREAGVPAPRTAYARVFVTVPGKHDRKYFGLYSLVENVDKSFVIDHGLGRGGALFKPSTPDVFAHLGDDWEAYDQIYDPKTGPTRGQARRVIELSRLITRGTDEEVAARLGDFIDLDEFARFLAVTAWIGDLDSILSTGQNYYLYLDPNEGRLQFIPWDKDHTFGSWIAGDPEERPRHSIREPWEGRKRFLERAFKVEAFRGRYLAAMAKFAQEHARPEQIEAYVSEVAAAIRPAVAEESSQKLKRFDTVVAGKPIAGGPFNFGKPTPSLLMFARRRAASVKEQLAGESEGHLFGRPGPGGKMGPPGPPFEEILGAALLKALDADKDKALGREEFVGGFGKWFAAWDTRKAGALSEDQIRKGLNKALPFSFGPPPRDGSSPRKTEQAKGEKDSGGP